MLDWIDRQIEALKSNAEEQLGKDGQAGQFEITVQLLKTFIEMRHYYIVSLYYQQKHF